MTTRCLRIQTCSMWILSPSHSLWWFRSMSSSFFDPSEVLQWRDLIELWQPRWSWEKWSCHSQWHCCFNHPGSWSMVYGFYCKLIHQNSCPQIYSWHCSLDVFNLFLSFNVNRIGLWCNYWWRNVLFAKLGISQSRWKKAKAWEIIYTAQESYKMFEIHLCVVSKKESFL